MPTIDRASLYWLFGLAPPADAAPDPPQLRPPPVGADLWLRSGLSVEEREKARAIGRLSYRSAGVKREVFWKPPETEAMAGHSAPLPPARNRSLDFE